MKLITDRDTGRPRGFGFVEMGSDEEANQAISELNDYELDGRQLNVNEARERTGGKEGNKGCEAALAGLEMVTLLRRLED